MATIKEQVKEKTKLNKKEHSTENSQHGWSPREATTNTPQANMYICTLNTQTLREESRIRELEHAVDRIKWDVIGLSEIRRNHECIKRRKTGLLFCHGTAKNGSYGVGFCVKDTWISKIIEFRPISVRLATLALEINKQKRLILIQVHAPTSESSTTEIEDFYSLLEIELNRATRNKGTTCRTHTIVLGDFNAKIGPRQQGEEQIMGKSHYGIRNERGERLIYFASQHQLKIANSFFMKPEGKKWTWKSPAGYKNEIDFILTQDMESISNIEVLNNFEFVSDHRIVRATLKLKKENTRRKYWDKIPDGESIKSHEISFKTKLLNNTSTLTQTGNPQELYNNLENAIIKAAKGIPAVKEDKTKKFRDDTLKLIRRRTSLERINNKNAETKIELAETRKLVRKCIRRDTKEQEELLVHEIMESSRSTRRLKREMSTGRQWIPKIHQNAHMEYERNKILKTATEFYRNLYSNTDPTPPEKSGTHKKTTNNEEVPAFMEDEIVNIIRTLKNNKSPGEDKITNEMLKTGNEILAQPLLSVFNKILQTTQIPEQWTKSEIILLHKKGDKSNINNYRPISLIPNMYKLFSKLIQRRIKNVLEQYQTEEQAGFRKNRSTIDHLHVINQLVEKANEYCIQVYIAFVDFHKAFDSLKHHYLWKALKEANVEETYRQIIKAIYTKNTATIRLEKSGEEFPIEQGVRQGDPLSPDLFNCLLKYATQDLNWEVKDRGININGRKLNKLYFADDIVLFANSAEELQQLLTDLNQCSKKVGLRINFDKTKVMTNGRKTNISIEDIPIEYVNEYVYLGQTISFEDRLDKEISKRITNAWNKYWSLKSVFKSKMHIATKRKIFDSCISPIITYGSQTWAMTEKQIRSIRVQQNKMERSMLGISWQDKMSIKEMKSITKIADIITTIKSLKWSWAGHVMRSQGWCREITDWYPLDRKRKKGRQRKRWADEIKLTAGHAWSTKARNREEWKELGEAFVQRGNHL